MSSFIHCNILILFTYFICGGSAQGGSKSRLLAVEQGDRGGEAAKLQPEDEALREIERYRSSLHRWDPVVRGFRSDHHLALSTDYDQGVWRALGDGLDRGRKIRSQILQMSFLYAFHLRLWNSLGYFVGTKTGIGLVESAENSAFKSGRYYRLPGITGGVVWHWSPALRFLAGVEGGLMRMENFQLEAFKSDISDANQSLEDVNVTAPWISYRFGVDFFFQLELGVRFEYSSYNLEYQGDRRVSVKRHGEIWTLGLLRHLI